MAYLTPLNLTDSLETSLSLCFYTFSSNFDSEDIAWLFTNFVDKPKFSYSSVLFAVPFS